MLTRLLSAFGFEKRDAGSPFAPDAWGRAIRPGAFVSPGAVLSNLAVAVRCVSLRSELMASVPLKLYRKLPNGDRERVTDSPLSDVLGDLANPLQTAFESREFLIRSCDLHGNAWARIERDGQGQVTALWPLEPTRVQVERLETGRIRYRYSGSNGPVVLLQEEVLHIRASSEDGLLGRSPIAIARDALALGIDLNSTANTLASTGLRISGVMSHPGKLSPKAKDAISTSIEEKHGGPKNVGRVLVAEEGMKFQPTQFSSSDSELLESRKLSNEDVARIFGVPPASVGISNSVSYGSAQQAAADLVSNALAPLASRIEQAMQRCLLTPAGRRTLFIEHDLSGLLRSDDAARVSAWKTEREIGSLSVNEIRRMANRPGIGPEGDSYAPLRGQAPQAEPPIASVKP